MFRSLTFRLLISYIAVILICLFLVSLGLLIFVRTGPLWTQAMAARVEASAQATLPALRRSIAAGALNSEEIAALLADTAEEQQVRVLIVDAEGRVALDSDSAWEGSTLDGFSPERPQRGPSRTGFFKAPSGGRWVFAGEVISNVDRRTIIFAAPQTQRVMLTWFLENVIPPLAQAGGIALILSIILAGLLTRSVAGPLQRVADTAQALAQGKLEERAPISGPREVRALARSFNGMADQVEASQRAQRDFVANVSHELKTPLTSIQGFSQALLDGTAETPEASSHAAHIINEEADRMRRLVDDLLILARMDARQAPLSLTAVTLQPLLERCVERMTPQAEAAEVDLRLSAPQAQALVSGDADRLAQVFVNLLDNAIAHTPAGGAVFISLESNGEARQATVTIRDEGSGIPPEDLPRIFERFYQVDKSRRHTRGAGLGLAISQEIVHAHDGTIEVESAIGQGSTFLVHLPVSP